MSKKKNKIIRVWICLCLLLCLSGMCGCTKEAAEEGTTVSVGKDGSITCYIVESFDKPYYDAEEMKQMILSEVAGYNKSVGEGNISVEKVLAEEGLVTVLMKFASATDYADFHGNTFFIGTAREAREAGYDLNLVLSSTEDELETIGMSDMLAMEEYRILITDMKEPVTLNGKAAYVSDNTIYSNSLRTVVFGGEADDMAYVMYR